MLRITPIWRSWVCIIADLAQATLQATISIRFDENSLPLSTIWTTYLKIWNWLILKRVSQLYISKGIPGTQASMVLIEKIIYWESAQCPTIPTTFQENLSSTRLCLIHNSAIHHPPCEDVRSWLWHASTSKCWHRQKSMQKTSKYACVYW